MQAQCICPFHACSLRPFSGVFVGLVKLLAEPSERVDLGCDDGHLRKRDRAGSPMHTSFRYWQLLFETREWLVTALVDSKQAGFTSCMIFIVSFLENPARNDIYCSSHPPPPPRHSPRTRAAIVLLEARACRQGQDGRRAASKIKFASLASKPSNWKFM